LAHSELPRSDPSPSIRVHGQIHDRGRTVSECSVVFSSATPGTAASDWDLTDAEGRYEVWLPAGAYAVACEDDTSVETQVVLPAGVEMYLLDLDIAFPSRGAVGPPRERARSRTPGPRRRASRPTIPVPAIAERSQGPAIR
jgi:hypothetical protein